MLPFWNFDSGSRRIKSVEYECVVYDNVNVFIWYRRSQNIRRKNKNKQYDLRHHIINVSLFHVQYDKSKHN